MLLFHADHVQPILSGAKTETRRLWARRRARVGALHQAMTELYGPPFARLRIKYVRREPLGAMTLEDARREGYDSLEEYAEIWEHINGPGSWNPERYVWVVGFVVEETAHGTNERGDGEDGRGDGTGDPEGSVPPTRQGADDSDLAIAPAPWQL